MFSRLSRARVAHRAARVVPSYTRGIAIIPKKAEYDVGVIAGDGIGKFVIPEGKRALDAVGQRFGFKCNYTDYPWSVDYYFEHGHMMPDSAFDDMKQHDTILLGAVGDPARVIDSISLRGLLIPIRQKWDLYINLRPGHPVPGIKTPLEGQPHFDIAVVRENSEGEYAGAGGRIHTPRPCEVAVQTCIFTRHATERVVRYAFELARTRPAKKLASGTKSNAMQYVFQLWDEVVDEVAKEYPDITVESYHCDALAAKMIRDPGSLDVIVGSNLITDIMTDLLGAMQGSLGLPPSANIDPSGKHPSLFEPVHGSAPDIPDMTLANPIATLWCVAMMLDHVDQPEAARALEKAFCDVAGGLNGAKQVLTRDVGGNANGIEFTDEVIKQILK